MSAAEVVLEIGLTDAEITDLMVNLGSGPLLSRVTQMWCISTLLVAKKKEQSSQRQALAPERLLYCLRPRRLLYYGYLRKQIAVPVTDGIRSRVRGHSLPPGRRQEQDTGVVGNPHILRRLEQGQGSEW